MAQLKYQASSGRFAIRSAYSIDSPNAWLIANPANGASWVNNAYVENSTGWVDVELPD